MALLELKDFCLDYGNTPILRNINLLLNSGEVIGIQGESGCGKSSLFSCITKVIPTLIDGRTSGEIRIKDTSISQLSNRHISTSMGVVFQNPDTQLFFQSVEQELAFGMENHCFTKEEMDKGIQDALKLVELTSYRHKNPSQLSGGQKQLLVLACALTLKPSILLLDESFSQIDSYHTHKILPIIQQYAASGNGVLMIEHQPERLSICSSIYTLENHTLRREF